MLRTLNHSSRYFIIRIGNLRKRLENQKNVTDEDIIDLSSRLSFWFEENNGYFSGVELIVQQLFQFTGALFKFQRHAIAEATLVLFARKLEEYGYDGSDDISNHLYKKYKDAGNYKKAYEYISKNDKPGNLLVDLSDDKYFAIMEEKVLLRKREVELNKKLEKVAEVDENILNLELEALKAQLNPHFLFNALNAIQHYILSQHKSIAGEYLAKFSKLMKQILNISERASLSIEEECRLLENYLQLEQLRFEFNFDYKIELSLNRAYDEPIIPSFLIQPFIENAIIHGISNIDKGVIHLVFREVDNTIYLHIMDNGIGRAQSRRLKTDRKLKAQSKALKILKERCELLEKNGKHNITLKIRDLYNSPSSNAGTHVILRVIPKNISGSIKNTKYD